ncbi:MAG: acetolactate synthase small subunit [Candidatus Omnitrophica bacterium]|nr:acetolactate synthase small subunit [Candidatus Omnitrophota bacterium]MDD5611378.1 acetolactate synthase small subunit [Candidatus Omnitrophota bacterium]
MKHTISVLVENKFGVLARISGLFSARGYNIDSLAVGETEDPSVSRMTIVVNAADERILEQIKKQLNKLIDVISVLDLTKKKHYDRELIMAKINFSKTLEPKISKITKRLPVKIIHRNKDSYVIEAVLDQEQAKDLMASLEEIGIKELARTGRIALEP